MIKTTFPADFYNTITLPIGVVFAGQHYRDCTVGPETRSSDHRTYLTIGDSVDVDLARDAYLFDAYEEMRKRWDPVKDGKMRERPPLTPDQLRRGRRHLAIWRETAALTRVVKIGPIPETDVVDVALELTMDDVNAITAAAMEVDALVAKFRAENRAADQGTTGMVVDGAAFV